MGGGGLHDALMVKSPPLVLPITLLFIPVTMADIVLTTLACDDDAPHMFDMTHAESISDGNAADLLDVEEDAAGAADDVLCV